MTISLIEVGDDHGPGQPCYRIVLHPFFQPLLQILRDHHSEFRPKSTRPDLNPLPSRDSGAWLQRDRDAKYARRAAWFLRLRWQSDGSGRLSTGMAAGEVAMFLQVLNDVRICCWDRLDRPDPLPHMDHFTLKLDGFPKSIESLLCVLELATVIQSEVARATVALEEKGSRTA